MLTRPRVPDRLPHANAYIDRFVSEVLHEHPHHHISRRFRTALLRYSSDVSPQQLGLSSGSGEFSDRDRQGMEVDESAYMVVPHRRGEGRKSGMGSRRPRSRHSWPRGLGPDDFEAR